jgi:hypothetical protein
MATFAELEREPNTLSGSVYSTSAMARAFVAIQARKINRLLRSAKYREPFYSLRELRECYLYGRFLAVEQIPDWLRQRASEEESPSAVRLTLMPGVESRVLEAIRRQRPVQLEHHEILEVEACYKRLHYGGQVYSVGSYGALRHLWQAVQELVSACGWRECDAIEFALSNRVPDGLPIGVQLESNLVSGLSFLSVRVPLYMQPDEVARVYAQVRRAHKRKARYKGISEFTARFVRFVEEYRVQRPRAKWETIIAEWNRQHPQEPISEKQARNLISHYSRILRRIREQIAFEAQGG